MGEVVQRRKTVEDFEVLESCGTVAALFVRAQILEIQMKRISVGVQTNNEWQYNQQNTQYL
jgi:hypothetical protein